MNYDDVFFRTAPSEYDVESYAAEEARLGEAVELSTYIGPEGGDSSSGAEVIHISTETDFVVDGIFDTVELVIQFSEDD